MGLSTFIGSLAQPTSTGNQGYTGVGFTPKVVLFIANQATANGSSADASQLIGWAVSTSQRGIISGAATDNVSTTVSSRRESNGKCLSFYNPSASVLSEADLVSLDADGFTLNWTTADSTQRIVNYLAIGGTDLTNVACGTFSAPTSTGNKAVTGVGFQGTSLLLMCMQSTGALPDATTNLNLGWGFATSTTARASQAGIIRNGVAASTSSRTARYQRTTKCISVLVANATLSQEADFVSFDSDGFTINYTTAGNAANTFYLVMKGGQVKAISFNQATSTGNQTTTGVGFTPSAIFSASFNNISSTSIQATFRNSLGIASSSTKRGCIWSGDTEATTPTVDKKNLDGANLINMITEGATPTINATADLVSFDADGLTVNWTTADATAREIIALMIGANAVAGSTVKQLAALGAG